jgi:CTP:molybdopterin cytidylyltransferase MocA
MTKLRLVDGLVLAAGGGKRFGGPKAAYLFAGERLVDRAVRILLEGGCRSVVVVLGAWVGEVPRAETLVNEDWRSGMASSLRQGMAHLWRTSDADAAVVSLVDLVGLTPAAVRRLLESDSNLAAASFGGRRSNPVLLGRSHWLAAAASACGDQGARHYLAQHKPLLVDVSDVAEDLDLDTPPDEAPPIQPV